MHRRAAIVAGLAAILTVGLVPLAPAASQGAVVFVCDVDDAITPVTAEFIIASLQTAEVRGAALFILRLDTPGGLDVATRDIIQAFLASEIPTAVYVAPSGARAASAGFMIAMSADIVAMSSGTNMGAATPVAMGGGEIDETLHAKIIEDASAYMRSVAERRGRPVSPAVEAVSAGRSFAASEAIELGLADILADDLDTVIREISGRAVRTTEGEPLVLDLEGATVEALEMNLRQRVLATIANPQIAYFLLLLGVAGIYFELSTPGAVAPGVIGAVSLVLALLAFQQLPFSYAGLALLVLGVIFLILEVNVVSYGLLTLAGLISFVLGSLLLFRGPVPEMRLSPAFVLPLASAFVAIMAVMINLVVRAHSGRVLTGSAGLVSKVGRATDDFGVDGRGHVFVHGELWNARAAESVKRGDAVEIIKVGAGLSVEVRPLDDTSARFPTASDEDNDKRS